MTAPSDPANDFAANVERIVASLGPGECASYGEIAEEAGRPGAARAVGNLMRGASHLPWWRVIRADGSLAKGKEQGRRLAAEGVAIVNGRVRPAGR